MGYVDEVGVTMRPIDADQLYKNFEQKRRHFDFGTLGNIKWEIAHAQTLNVKQIVLGHWVDCTDDESIAYESACSQCGYSMFTDFTDTWKYCPNCGAKMVR